MAELEIYTDGGSRGNPGQAAIAFLVFRDGGIIFKHGEAIGIATNNEAEYNAIIKALVHVSLGYPKPKEIEITLTSDSEVVIRQLNGEYRVRKGHLLELNLKVRKLGKEFAKVSYRNEPRTNRMISMADSMVNEALDAL